MIPYNPSSFNTNKTILEQILELKKWLKEHPSYAVYTTYIHYKPAENVDYFFTEINGDPDFVDNIAVGDLLWFGDGYISPIASITIDPNDRENSYVTISQPVTSLIGPTGPQGPRGYDGVSVTNASVNASGYLIITLSNGLTVNTGYVVGPQGTTGPEGPEGPQGPTGPTGVSITNVAIDGNSHLIVTLSDGSTIDAGSVSSGSDPEIVTISGSSGTLVGDNLTKIQSDNCIIYHSGDNRYYRKGSLSSGTYIYYYDTSYANSSIAYANMIEIKKVGGQWTKSSGTIRYKPIASTIDSQTATNGQVLMADGNGGASWQTPSGSQLYKHCIYVGYSDSYEKIYVTAIIINNSNTQYTRSSLAQFLYNNRFTSYNGALYNASGYYYANNNNGIVVGLYSSNGTNPSITINQSNGNLGNAGLNSVTVTDTIITL